VSAYQHCLAVLRDERAATAVEYGLIIAMIVIAMIAALQGFANETIAMWGYVETSVENATTA